MRADLTRRLGTFEQFLWATDKWTPRHFVVVAQIEGELQPVSLADALAHAQRRHPALRVGIGTEAVAKPHFVRANATIPLRLIDRDSEDRWFSEVQTELAVPFRPEIGPLLRCIAVHGRTISEIILVVYHAIDDGMSAKYLLRDLLQGIQGMNLVRLPPRPSLEELVIHQGALPSTSPSSRRSDAKLHRPCKPLISSFQIESRQTATILARCREEQTTLQGALMAAAMISLEQPVVRCLAPINLRPLCPPIEDDFGLYISSGFASFMRDDAVDFWSLARQARAQSAGAFDPKSLQGRFARLSALLAVNHDPQSIYEAYRQGVTFDVVVSNLGEFSTSDQTNVLRVTALYLLLNTELEPSIAVATAEGRMCVSGTFDSPTPPQWFEKFEHLIRSTATLAAR
jgi:hypothetical protein